MFWLAGGRAAASTGVHLTPLDSYAAYSAAGGERAHPVAHILVDIARDLAGRSRRAFGFQLADAAIFCTRAIGENPALIDDP